MVIIFARRPKIACEGVLRQHGELNESIEWEQGYLLTWLCLPNHSPLAVAVRRSAATRCPHSFSDRFSVLPRRVLPCDKYRNMFPTIRLNLGFSNICANIYCEAWNFCITSASSRESFKIICANSPKSSRPYSKLVLVESCPVAAVHPDDRRL